MKIFLDSGMYIIPSVIVPWLNKRIIIYTMFAENTLRVQVSRMQVFQHSFSDIITVGSTIQDKFCLYPTNAPTSGTNKKIY